MGKKKSDIAARKKEEAAEAHELVPVAAAALMPAVQPRERGLVAYDPLQM